MKKIVFLIGIILFSVSVFAQTSQSTNTANAQGTNSDNFARGGYTGPVLGTIAIGDLMNTTPNEFVIVEGYLVQQRVPGTYILAEAPDNSNTSVVIRLNPYFWSNLEIDGNTPVLVYGTVNRSELRIELEATRIEIKQ